MRKKLYIIPALLLVPFALMACGDDDTTDDGIFDGGDGTTNGADDTDGDANGLPGADDGTTAANGAYDFENAETTDNGVRYIDETVGDGESPTLDSEVEVHYQGMLRDGTLFDSSIVRGQPETFQLMEVIPGFAEGVLGMQEGGKRVMLVPSELAYGPEGFADIIPPDADLIFEVELLEVR